MSESVFRECPTCRGRPWVVWGFSDEGWPLWCPGCGGRGRVLNPAVPVVPEADVPYVVTDDDEEG